MRFDGFLTLSKQVHWSHNWEIFAFFTISR